MYTRCIHCHGALGRNDQIERFPVGRRLAFDASRGRLWVVCPSCCRWNLTPLEERWEAVEDCERLYRETPRRFSTEQIGMARRSSGLDLIRIGRPPRLEFAAWRYGDQFGRRRRRFLVRSAAGSVVGVVVNTAWKAGMLNPMLGVAALTGGAVIGYARRRLLEARRRQVVTRVAAPNGDSLAVTRDDLAAVVLAPPENGRLALALARGREHVRFTDGAALRVGALTLAERNAAGASERQVRMAVEKLEWFKGPDGMLEFALRRGGLDRLGYEQRLAVEMALHEESERRALEGELALLEHAWREAEELAGIADDLLLPPAVSEWLARRSTA